MDLDLRRSLKRAVSFLIASQHKSGWWRDYDTLAGASDEWVTAYVGLSLARTQGDRASSAAEAAWKKLSRRRPWSAGWGYNRRVPADSDSTVWAVRLAGALGRSRSFRAGRGRGFIDRHVLPSGSIATFRKSYAIRLFTGLLRNGSFQGWCAPHDCVSAAAAVINELPRHKQILDSLRRSQNDDGAWTGYWWVDREYSTALAAEALSLTGEPDDVARVERAVEWSGARLMNRGWISTETNPSGSPFATALCLRILCFSVNASNVKRLKNLATSWLVENQAASGAWPASAALRIPPPDLVDPENYEAWQFGGMGGGSINLDVNALFTTATVLSSLQPMIEGQE